MCIRDRAQAGLPEHERRDARRREPVDVLRRIEEAHDPVGICLLYTSDAAGERSSVDLGGRRIIKKNKNKKNKKKKKKTTK